jgi:hypothetical protein
MCPAILDKIVLKKPATQATPPPPQPAPHSKVTLVFLFQDNDGDVAAVAEGLDTGQGKLQALPLPLPTDGTTESQDETGAASPSDKLANNLDLEFPPLLAAKPVSAAGDSFLGIKPTFTTTLSARYPDVIIYD